MARGNTYPVVGSASYSSLESRRLPAPSLAPPTRDTTFDPRTPPMASYYYHCTGGERDSATPSAVKVSLALTTVVSPRGWLFASNSLRMTVFLQVCARCRKAARGVCKHTATVTKTRPGDTKRFQVYLGGTCWTPRRPFLGPRLARLAEWLLESYTYLVGVKPAAMSRDGGRRGV